MDIRRLAEMMSATLSEDKNQRDAAEEQLKQVCKIIGFVPALLEIVMQIEHTMPVRQATVVYLKNFISKNWVEKDADGHLPQMEFVIHEQDKDIIRGRIVEALVQAPELIRSQIATCIYNIIKSDFPGRWPQIVDKIQLFLHSVIPSNDSNNWSGAILCLYQLVKNYEYKKADERAPLDEAMNLLLPLIFDLMVHLLQKCEQTSECVLLQKNILKIYYTLIQFCLPLDLITNDVFTKWMEICQYVITCDVPIDVTNIDEDDRLELPWWKAKKWAMHICVRTFERYGSPGNVVNKEYQKFAEWYLPTFTGGILESLFKVLQQYGAGIYVSPRVLTEVLNYIKIAVQHAHSWKILKPHMINIIRDIIFPIMQYSETDEDLYNNDTIEYIRRKFDIYDDYSTPVPAAQVLFSSCCKTRKGILPEAMAFLNEMIINREIEPRKRDGALYMIGSVAEVLMKKKEYRDQLEGMLQTHIFPEFDNQFGHMRARACWVLHSFSEVKFKNPAILSRVLELATNALLTDPDLPVRVEAAIVLQEYLSAQDDAARILEPHIQQITMQLLHIIKETELDDLSSALQKVVQTFSEQLMPVAVDICKQLEMMFSEIIQDDDGTDDRDETAMGLLHTIETLLSVFEEDAVVNANLQPCIISVIRLILQRNSTYFYEEAFSLAHDLTSKSISPEMWGMLRVIHEVFKQDAMDCFLDLMPALHNYITVDTQTFLSNEEYIKDIFDMCETVLTHGDAGEDAECHAAKLIEVIILQCKGHIDSLIPHFVRLAVDRLVKKVTSSELRTMCLQVLIAVLYSNPILSLQLLLNYPSNNEPILPMFIKQWLDDTDCFLGVHDRKLYVLGLCTAMNLRENKPFILNELADKILPSLLVIFEGLKRAYQSRANEDEDEESDEENDDDCEEALSSDEDDVEEFNSSYLDNMKNFATKGGAKKGLDITAEIKDDDEESDEDDFSDYDLDETALEVYLTPIDDEDTDNHLIDEYIVFQDTITALQGQDPQFYALLVQNLNQEQTMGLQKVNEEAQRKRDHYASKRIEQQGGYSFQPPSVPPTNFNFGG